MIFSGVEDVEDVDVAAVEDVRVKLLYPFCVEQDVADAARAVIPKATPATLMVFPAICRSLSSYSKSFTSCSHLGTCPYIHP